MRVSRLRLRFRTHDTQSRSAPLPMSRAVRERRRRVVDTISFAFRDGSWSAGDMAADIFVSRVGGGATPGSDTSAARGYEGVGAGSARRFYYRIIARAAGSGASQSVTEAHYRYDIR